MRNVKSTRCASPLFRLTKLVAISLAAVTLAACQHNGYQKFGGYVFTDYKSRHPIAVSKQPKHISVTVKRGSHGLTKQQTAKIRGFLGQYKHEGYGKLFVSAPSGAPNEVATYNALTELRELVRLKGISSDAIYFQPYSADGDPTPSIRMSFKRYVAEGPECGDWTENLTRNHKNLPYPNYGCAYQRNIAAMVANPRDLVEPQGTTPKGGERRDVTWDKYIKGESTESEKSENSSSTISEL